MGFPFIQGGSFGNFFRASCPFFRFHSSYFPTGFRESPPSKNIHSNFPEPSRNLVGLFITFFWNLFIKSSFLKTRRFWGTSGKPFVRLFERRFSPFFPFLQKLLFSLEKRLFFPPTFFFPRSFVFPPFSFLGEAPLWVCGRGKNLRAR